MSERKRWDELTPEERKEFLKKSLVIRREINSDEGPECMCTLHHLSTYHGRFPIEFADEGLLLEDFIKRLSEEKATLACACLRVCPCMEHKESVAITLNDGAVSVDCIDDDVDPIDFLSDKRSLDLPNFD